MNGTDKIEPTERLHGVKDHAVVALTQLVALYLDKNSFDKQSKAQGESGHDLRGARKLAEMMAASHKIPAIAFDALEHPAPSALKNGMRAVGTMLYEETKSIDAMSDVLYRVMENFPNRDHEVVRVLDHAFDGIGGWWA